MEQLTARECYMKIYRAMRSRSTSGAWLIMSDAESSLGLLQAMQVRFAVDYALEPRRITNSIETRLFLYKFSKLAPLTKR